MFKKTQAALLKKRQKEAQDNLKEINENKLRLLDIVKNDVYPFLKENTDNIDDATIFIQSFAVAIEQAHINTRRTMTVADLKLFEMLNPNEEGIKRWKVLLNLMAKENIQDVCELFQNMYNEVTEQVRQKISKEQKLEDLNIKLYEKN